MRTNDGVFEEFKFAREKQNKQIFVFSIFYVFFLKVFRKWIIYETGEKKIVKK